MLDWLSNPNAWLGLLTLTVLEIVLGIDNIVFISILSGKLKTPEEQERARKLGLGLALISRVLLLLSIGWVTRLTFPVFELPIVGVDEHPKQVSWRDIILATGGAFLMYKAVKEIHAKLEGEETHGEATVAPKLSAILIQILILDVVFSLDSVITAVGMVQDVSIMIAAVVIAVGFMMFFSGPIAKFVERHPTVKMLALSFLILIGVSLVAESFEKGIPKGYIYFAMAFSVVVEMLNLRVRKGAKPVEPVHLHEQTP
jgi:predicted tellurium resistance membrane protein TerC